MPEDTMIIEILEDGTIKTITDPISGANHASADAFIKEMGRLAGGETTRTKRTDKTKTTVNSDQTEKVLN